MTAPGEAAHFVRNVRLLSLSETAWMERAACRRLEGEVADFVFFGAGRIQYAASFCDYCPVRRDCLNHALRFESAGYDAYGVYGGVRAEDRAKSQ